MGHVRHYNQKVRWEKIGGNKDGYFNNHVFYCGVEPTPNSTGDLSQNSNPVPTSSPTALIEGAVGNGCENPIQLSCAFETVNDE